MLSHCKLNNPITGNTYWTEVWASTLHEAILFFTSVFKLVITFHNNILFIHFKSSSPCLLSKNNNTDSVLKRLHTLFDFYQATGSFCPLGKTRFIISHACLHWYFHNVWQNGMYTLSAWVLTQSCLHRKKKQKKSRYDKVIFKSEKAKITPAPSPQKHQQQQHDNNTKPKQEHQKLVPKKQTKCKQQ